MPSVDNFMPRHSNAGSTTDELLAAMDLRGMTAMIAGTSSGLGLGGSRGLASLRAEVSLESRDLKKAQQTANRVASCLARYTRM